MMNSGILRRLLRCRQSHDVVSTTTTRMMMMMMMTTPSRATKSPITTKTTTTTTTTALFAMAVVLTSTASSVATLFNLQEEESSETENLPFGPFGQRLVTTATTTTSTTTNTTSNTSFCEAASSLENNNHNNNNNGKAKLVFMGTGSSTGCPKPICMMDSSEMSKSDKCRISRLAVGMMTSTDSTDSTNTSTSTSSTDPAKNKNYRNNPSLLIHTHDGKNIIIDVGKTFREGAIRWLPRLKLNTTLDAVILTHHHMDAVAGLDDLRGFQGIQRNDNDGSWSRIPIPVFLSKLCHREVQSQFPWLFPSKEVATTSNTTDAATPVVVKRDVASLQVTRFEDYKSFDIYGVIITPLPIWHGDDLISHGFAISIPSSSSSKSNNNCAEDGRPLNVVYLSDISRMIPETMEYILKELPQPTDIFICDALLWHQPHSVHYSLDQAVELAKQIQPTQGTYLVGMSCDSFLPHDEMNAWLRAKYYEYKDNNNGNDDNENSRGKGDKKTSGGNTEQQQRMLVQLAHDGLVAAEV